MRSTVFVLLVAASMAFVSSKSIKGVEEDVEQEFQQWKQKFEKSYSSPDEEAERKQLWLKTRELVTEHNKRADQGLETYWMGVNQFADLRPGEWKPCLRVPRKRIF